MIHASKVVGSLFCALIMFHAVQQLTRICCAFHCQMLADPLQVSGRCKAVSPNSRMKAKAVALTADPLCCLRMNHHLPSFPLLKLRLPVTGGTL
jgi:hypothetical protein